MSTQDCLVSDLLGLFLRHGTGYLLTACVPFLHVTALVVFLCMYTPRHKMLPLPDGTEYTPINWEQFPVICLGSFLCWLHVNGHVSGLWVNSQQLTGCITHVPLFWLTARGIFSQIPFIQYCVVSLNCPCTCMTICLGSWMTAPDFDLTPKCGLNLRNDDRV